MMITISSPSFRNLKTGTPWPASNRRQLALNHPQLDLIDLDLTQIVLENLARDRSLDISKGTVLAREHFPERRHMGLTLPCLEHEALRQKSAQAIERQI